MADLWENLVRTYAQATVPAPGLKIVTLAQWALESNFGQSELARDHLNFGGLKFRARVNRDQHLADPVDYVAHDGLDTYCAFSSLDTFIAGYWAFIDNGPYDGWRAFADDPSGYIGHLHRAGYAGDPDYVAKVVNIFPRIRRQVADLGLSDLLAADALPPRDLFKLAVLIGHNTTAQGAWSPFLGVSEWKFNQRIYRHMEERAPEFEIETRQFFREPAATYKAEIAAAYAAVDAWAPTAVLELHFNSFNATAHGTEMLYWDGSAPGKLLADRVREAVLDEFGFFNRGSKGRRSGRGSTSLGASDYPTILTEPFFGDNTSDCAKVLNIGEEALARAYLIGARDAMEAF